MFDSLSDRFETIFTRMRGRGRLGEKEIDEIAREIRLALLEADVNFKVVKSFIGRVKEQADRGRAVQEPLAGPAGHQDRPRRADQHPRVARPAS